MSLNASLLIAPLISILTGKIIEAGTNGDGSKMLARANELIAINTALTQINTGNAAGLPALQAAFNTTSLTPGESLALQSLFGGLANQIALLTSVAGSTLVGQANTVIFDSILQTATTTAQAYVTKYGTPATQPAAAA
jgi:hypothetical protein